MIFLFNASPKGKNSNTAYFLKLLKDRLGEPCSYAELSEMQDTVILGVKMIESDAVVIGMPVHLNAVPAMLLERMEALYAEFAGAFEDLPLYVIANGGEYESEKLRILVKIMENWCGRMKMRYCGALAIGAGEMLGRLNQESGWEKINQKLFEGIGHLAGAVSQKCRIEDIYLKPPNGYTKFTYMLGARLRFNRIIKANYAANQLLRASRAEKKGGEKPMGIFGLFQKKEEENATLPRTEAEKWVTYTYAMWSEAAEGDWHYIAGSTAYSKPEGASMRTMLRRDWEVSNKTELLDMVTYLTALYEDGTECEAEDIKSGAWDLCRACQILGMGYVGGYIDRDEMFAHAFAIGRIMQRYYSSWIELYGSYIQGYRKWRTESGGSNVLQMISERENLCERILSYADGPCSISWELPL